MYDPSVGAWLSEDPLGFRSGTTNLFEYVGNNSTNFVDPTGLAAENWAWNWHHMLPQAVFTPEFLNRHQLDIDIGAAEHGFMLRGHDHTEVHRNNWNKQWEKWIQKHEKNGTRITKEMVDRQRTKMIEKFHLGEKGFPAKFPYDVKQAAYQEAERLARQAAEKAGKAGRKAASAVCEAADDVKTKGSGWKGKAKAKGVGGVVGFCLSIAANLAMGSEHPLDDALEGLDPFEPSSMGNAEIPRGETLDPSYVAWDQEQIRLNTLQAEREPGAPPRPPLIDREAAQAAHFGPARQIYPSSTPQRPPLFPGARP